MLKKTIAMVLLGACMLHGQRRSVATLNEGWRFIRTDLNRLSVDGSSDWQDVTLPHTWNDHDAQSGGAYYAGTAWYEKVLNLLPDKGRVWLKFEGVGQTADVFVNGQKMGSHEGAYSAFCVDITPALNPAGRQVLRVKVDNRARPDVIPVNHNLFMVFGGIYRPVWLIRTGNTHLGLSDEGSPGVVLTQRAVSRSEAVVDVNAWVEHRDVKAQNARFEVTVLDAGGRECADTRQAVRLLPGAGQNVSTQITLKNPMLWHGRKNPYLYKVITQLVSGDTVLDEVVLPLGLRTYSVDPDRGFMLNGEPYRLYGVCRHQEWENCGSALSEAQHRADFEMIHEMGATSVRLAHYQQAEYVYSLCDSLGLVVWAEIPFVNRWSGQERVNALQQMSELIKQNRHHPAICIWGLHNEVYAHKREAYPIELTRDLHRLAKKLDPERLTVSVTGYGDPERPMNGHADLQGHNRYFGWYEGGMHDMEAWIKSVTGNYPDMRFCVAEYGCGANVAHQCETLPEQPHPTQGQFFPEIYQTRLHESQWAAIARHPEIWASYVWNMYDFAVPGWNRGGIPGRNHKGLVSYDRQTRKDAFYFYKACWSDEPVLHIAEKRCRERHQAAAVITVYSNQKHVTLKHNGREVSGRKVGASGARFTWQVTLAPGENIISAAAGSGADIIRDEARFMLKQGDDK